MINRAIMQFGLVLLVLTAAGCTTGYWLDRGRDAADIFTCTVGLGWGAKVRAGPVHAGLGQFSDYTGLRGGNVGRFDMDACGEADSSLWPLILTNANAESYWGGEKFLPASPGDERGKGFTVRHRYAFFFDDVPEVAHERQRLDKEPEVSWPYYTAIEVSAGLGGAIRLGVNPGELLDFLLGWFGVDIYGDDITAEADENAAVDRIMREHGWR